MAASESNVHKQTECKPQSEETRLTSFGGVVTEAVMKMSLIISSFFGWFVPWISQLVTEMAPVVFNAINAQSRQSRKNRERNQRRRNRNNFQNNLFRDLFRGTADTTKQTGENNKMF